MYPTNLGKSAINKSAILSHSGFRNFFQSSHRCEPSLVKIQFLRSGVSVSHFLGCALASGHGGDFLCPVHDLLTINVGFRLAEVEFFEGFDRMCHDAVGRGVRAFGRVLGALWAEVYQALMFGDWRGVRGFYHHPRDGPPSWS